MSEPTFTHRTSYPYMSGGVDLLASSYAPNVVIDDPNNPPLCEDPETGNLTEDACTTTSNVSVFNLEFGAVHEVEGQGKHLVGFSTFGKVGLAPLNYYERLGSEGTTNKVAVLASGGAKLHLYPSRYIQSNKALKAVEDDEALTQARNAAREKATAFANSRTDWTPEQKEAHVKNKVKIAEKQYFENYIAQEVHSSTRILSPYVGFEPVFTYGLAGEQKYTIYLNAMVGAEIFGNDRVSVATGAIIPIDIYFSDRGSELTDGVFGTLGGGMSLTYYFQPKNKGEGVLPTPKSTPVAQPQTTPPPDPGDEDY